jgi:hypothetical protein
MVLKRKEPSKLMVLKRNDRVKLRNHQNWWFSEFQPPPPLPLNANLLFCSFFLNLTLCMTKLRVLVPSLSDFMDMSNILQIYIFLHCGCHSLNYFVKSFKWRWVLGVMIFFNKIFSLFLERHWDFGNLFCSVNSTFKKNLIGKHSPNFWYHKIEKTNPSWENVRTWYGVEIFWQFLHKVKLKWQWYIITS